MIDFEGVLAHLSELRPVFHSEADFQHAYAWEIQRAYPDAKLRLEYRNPGLPGRGYTDIWVELLGQRTAIELKYKTRRIVVEVAGETFALLDQGAQDQGRYDFCRDVSRIERIRQCDATVHGVAIFLTNDSSYWRAKKSLESVDTQFRLCHGAVLQGNLAWLAHAGPGTKQGRILDINLRQSYKLTWNAYSEVPSSRHNVFKYLAVVNPAAK